MTVRIVVTGIGVVSPFGVGPEVLWDKLMAGESGIQALTTFDASHVQCRAGGQVSDFRPEAYLNPRLVRKIDRFSMFGLIAAQHALADAGLTPGDLERPVPADAPEFVRQAKGRDRVGITVG